MTNPSVFLLVGGQHPGHPCHGLDGQADGGGGVVVLTSPPSNWGDHSDIFYLICADILKQSEGTSRLFIFFNIFFFFPPLSFLQYILCKFREKENL